MDIVEYTEFLVKRICSDCDMVKVSCYTGESEKTILDVLVPENIMGAVLGKGGRNIKAIRTLVNAYAYLHKMGRVEIHIESF